MLEEYFGQNNLFPDLDFTQLSETKVEPIYSSWLSLPPDQAKAVEKDFREIDFLANEGGIKAIIDEARWHWEELGEQFSQMSSFHEKALLDVLESPGLLDRRGTLPSC